MARKGITRTVRRVTQNHRNRAENREFYQSAREWTQFHDDQSVERRRSRITAAVPALPFVPGIIHNPENHGVDGLDAGKVCNC